VSGVHGGDDSRKCYQSTRGGDAELPLMANV
jgi:hypothetical protein